MVTDYRYLNQGTVKNNYPLLLISQLIDRVKGCDLFMKMDRRWGYNNIRIRAGDEWKWAFVTARGSFEPMVMFFGMCNSPGTMQQMMNKIFADMLIVFLIIFMDDLLIATKKIPKELHIQKTKQVLQRLREHGLCVKATKCSFFQMEVEFLGMWVSQKGVRMDEGKVSAVVNWKPPSRVK